MFLLKFDYFICPLTPFPFRFLIHMSLVITPMTRVPAITSISPSCTHAVYCWLTMLIQHYRHSRNSPTMIWQSYSSRYPLISPAIPSQTLHMLHSLHLFPIADMCCASHPQSSGLLPVLTPLFFLPLLTLSKPLSSKDAKSNTNLSTHL